jgi:hypothetical protein
VAADAGFVGDWDGCFEQIAEMRFRLFDIATDIKGAIRFAHCTLRSGRWLVDTLFPVNF